MATVEQGLRDIRLGSRVWCVLKSSVIDPEKIEKPEFLVHLSNGYVQSKGVELSAEGRPVLFVEVAGQRMRASFVFKTAAQATSKAESMMAEMAEGLKALPEQS